MIATHRTLWAFWLVGLISLTGCPNKPKAPQAVAVEPGGPKVAALAFAQSAEELEAAPIRLTASDGTGLALVALEARTVVEEPLSFTELHLTFHNPESRRREGRFQIVLPEAAAISRFAMRVNGELQEGEVVELRRAQRVYEDFLHRKQDPALLEKAASNEFSARVFPIEPNADKEVVIAYSEELPQRDVPLRLHVAGLPRIARFSVDVRLSGNTATGLESTGDREGPREHLHLEKSDYAPRSDVLLTLPWRKPFALRSGELVVARVRPVAESAPQEIDGLTVLFDTSASRALGFSAQIERVAELGAELVRQNGRDFDLRIVAFDQDAEELYRGKASAFALRDKGRLLSRGAFGATDFEKALSRLAEQPDEHERLLVITDGVVSAGGDDITRLREAVAKLAAHGLSRLDVLAEGSLRDRGLMERLTQAGLKQTGCVLDAAAPVATSATRLLRSVRESVPVHIAGARWVHPAALRAVQPGDERLIFAELPADAPVQIELADAGAVALPTLEAPRPLLERAMARAKLEALTQTLHESGQLSPEERAELARRIVALSTEHRVLSELTALLVLESAADYRRFGISQNALSSVLQVTDQGLALVDRKPKDLPQIARGAVEEAADEGEAPDDEARPVATAEAQEPPPTSRTSPAPRMARSDEAAAEPSVPSEARSTRARGELERKADMAPEPRHKAAARRASGDERLSASAAQSAPPAAPMKVAAPSTASPRPSSSAGSAALDIGGGGAPLPPALPTLQIAQPVRRVARAQVVLHHAEGLPQPSAARVVRALSPRARACYERASPDGAAERAFLDFTIAERGTVSDVFITSGAIADPRVRACVLSAARRLQFEKPSGGRASIQAGVELSFVEAPSGGLAQSPPRKAPRPRPRVKITKPALEDAYEGALAAVLSALAAGDTSGARSRAEAAHEADPGDVLALIALGEALEAQRDLARAARVYGSLIDLFPARADLRRMAGERLERLGTASLDLTIDTYTKALAQRPDHPSAHRLLAYALLKRGDPEAAFRTLEAALDQPFASDRFVGVERILKEDLALVGAAWLRSAPDHEPAVRASLAAREIAAATQPSLRFVLNWETDANDVDFHIYDGSGGHAYYMRPRLSSGGALYADITTGYGPECFAISGARRSYPYVLQAHYFARGPMGFGMGKLEVIQHDGKGRLQFDEHPFLIMKDKAFVELARLAGPL